MTCLRALEVFSLVYITTPLFLLKCDVDPQVDRWYNDTTQHLQCRQRSWTSDKTPRLGSSFILHQCSVSSYTSKVTRLGIVRNKIHHTPSLLIPTIMSPCMKAIGEQTLFITALSPPSTIQPPCAPILFVVSYPPPTFTPFYSPPSFPPDPPLGFTPFSSLPAFTYLAPLFLVEPPSPTFF